jgi:hypothetical protein
MRQMIITLQLFLGSRIALFDWRIDYRRVMSSLDLASWQSWQGYLLGPIGGKEGQWAYANLGVIAALIIGFIGHILLSRSDIKKQDV